MFQPPKVLPTREYLETEYSLPDFGVYDFYYTPYFLGVAEALDQEEVDEVDLMKAAQIGWTFFLIGYIFKRIIESDINPCPIMALFAKTGDGKNFHDEKLVPAAKATLAVAKRIDVSTTRKSGNRWDNKNYNGGFLKLVGSNSPGNVKSTSKVGVGIVEEPDDTADNVAGQGDAIGLLEERLKRYVGSKLIVGGTPAVKGLSKTEARLDQTDKRLLPIQCHECNQSHVLDFANVVWNEDDSSTDHPVYGKSDPESAVYVCPECGTPWDDYQRQENIRNTCFTAYNAGDKNAGWTPTAEFHGRAGFMGLSELYVCMPGTGLSDVVQDYLAAKAESEKGNENAMIKFINQKLGQSYEYQDDNATADEIREKAEDYPELLVPRDGLVLTMGIDIQRDRVAIIIRAWGRGMESWLVYWGEIWAQVDINDINDPVWSELDKLLFGSYQHETGAYLRITAACLDTSDGMTQGATYHYVRSRQNRGVNLMAIKGAQSYDAPIVILPRKIDLNNLKTKADKFGLQLWRLGTQAIKDQIAGRLKLTGNGPGRMHHYESVRPDYPEQMTGEVKAPSRTQRGKKVWQQKSGASIEAWDCEGYAFAAAHVEKLHIKKPVWWDAKTAALVQVDLLGDQTPADRVISIDHRPEAEDLPETETSEDLATEDENPEPVATVEREVTNKNKRLSMAELGQMMGSH